MELLYVQDVLAHYIRSCYKKMGKDFLSHKVYYGKPIKKGASLISLTLFLINLFTLRKY